MTGRLIRRHVKLMKAHIVFYAGCWWCFRIGVTGQGSTPKAAHDDMWNLYQAAMRRSQLEAPERSYRLANQ